MPGWAEYIQLGKKADEHRKKGQYGDALDCLSIVVQAIQSFADQAEEQGNSPTIVVANWDLAISFMITCEIYLEMNQTHKALPYMLEGIKRFEQAAERIDGETKRILEEKIESARKRFLKITTFERNMHELVFKLASMDPIAKDVTLLYARRLLQIPTKHLATKEDRIREIQRALIDAYFRGKMPETKSEIEAFNVFVIENAEIIMGTSLEIASNYGFHPFITS